MPTNSAIFSTGVLSLILSGCAQLAPPQDTPPNAAVSAHYVAHEIAYTLASQRKTMHVSTIIGEPTSLNTMSASQPRTCELITAKENIKTTLSSQLTEGWQITLIPLSYRNGVITTYVDLSIASVKEGTSSTVTLADKCTLPIEEVFTMTTRQMIEVRPKQVTVLELPDGQNLKLTADAL